MNLLSIDNLKVTARLVEGEMDIVKGMSLCVNRGEIVAILGQSGSGKTVAMESVLGLLKPNLFASGSILFQGENLLDVSEKRRRELSRDIVYIPQKGNESLNGVFDVKTHFSQTLKSLGIKDKGEIARLSKLYLKKAGLDSQDVLLKKPHELSGGMSQRVVFALAMCYSPKLVIADEPTRGIDSGGEKEYMSMLFNQFKDAGILIITHSIMVARHADIVAVMKEGELIEVTKASLIDDSEIDYVQLLISSTPKSKGFLIPLAEAK